MQFLHSNPARYPIQKIRKATPHFSCLGFRKDSGQAGRMHPQLHTCADQTLSCATLLPVTGWTAQKIPSWEEAAQSPLLPRQKGLHHPIATGGDATKLSCYSSLPAMYFRPV